MIDTQLYASLREEVDAVRVVDSHEHIWMPEEEYLELDADFTRFFLHYTSADLVSAGMDLDDMDRLRAVMGRPKSPSGDQQRAALGRGPVPPCALSLDEKWAALKPFWERARNTAYAKAILRSIRRLYDVEDLDDDTYAAITERMRAEQKAGVYGRILRDECNLGVSVNDADDMGTPEQIRRMDRDLFVAAGRVSLFLDAWNRVNVTEIERRTGRSVLSLNDLLDALDACFEGFAAEGRVAVKIGHAYSRILRFDDADADAAKRIFDRAFVFNGGAAYLEAKPFQDFMLHEVLRRCQAFGLPVIFHTGLQEGNVNLITNSNVTHLMNLFIKYPKVVFDIFHGSYPYTGELSAIAKNFPNVRIDMAWLHIISPAVARRCLSEWLETVPASKIHGFGGDYIMPEAVYGHLDMARENIAWVLAQKVTEGYFTETEAVEVARRLLRDNPMETFRIEERRPVWRDGRG